MSGAIGGRREERGREIERERESESTKWKHETKSNKGDEKRGNYNAMNGERPNKTRRAKLQGWTTKSFKRNHLVVKHLHCNSEIGAAERLGAKKNETQVMRGMDIPQKPLRLVPLCLAEQERIATHMCVTCLSAVRRMCVVHLGFHPGDAH